MQDPTTPRLNGRKVPETPPISVSKKPLGGLLPTFALPNKSPKSYVQKQLQTPASHGHNRTIDIMPPTSGLFPLLPQFTPKRSPHRRRALAGDIFASDAISMLLPNHAISGSGRKTQGPSKSLKAPLLLACDELARLNENLAFEEEETDSELESIDIETHFKKHENALCDSPSKGPRKSTITTFHAPATPGRQIISDAQAREWHGDSKGQVLQAFDDEGDGTKKELVNPFLSSSSFSSTSKTIKKSEVNFDTHMELINHRTGERRIEPLSTSQKRHQPRRLDFSQV